jgi:hypothetical protein
LERGVGLQLWHENKVFVRGEGARETHIIVFRLCLVGQDLADGSVKGEMCPCSCKRPMCIPSIEREHWTRVQSKQRLLSQPTWILHHKVKKQERGETHRLILPQLDIQLRELFPRDKFAWRAVDRLSGELESPTLLAFGPEKIALNVQEGVRLRCLPHCSSHYLHSFDFLVYIMPDPLAYRTAKLD